MEDNNISREDLRQSFHDTEAEIESAELLLEKLKKKRRQILKQFKDIDDKRQLRLEF